MLKRIEFKNYRCLRDAVIELDRLNLLVGPNGAGKSTLLRGLELVSRKFLSAASGRVIADASGIRTMGVSSEEPVVLRGTTASGKSFGVMFRCGAGTRPEVVWGALNDEGLPSANSPVEPEVQESLRGYRVHSFVPRQIGAPNEVAGQLALEPDGSNLVAVLDALRDHYPERFDQLNSALGEWFGEFDRFLFDVPRGRKGHKLLSLRVRSTQTPIQATELSDGTRLGLALLTLAWLPEPPALIGIEEPDRGIHPRLFHLVHDVLVRLAYPEEFNEQRRPVQVIATTHSPYLVDLFKEHPEHVVIAEKHGLEATFIRLTERADLLDALSQGCSLGEIWYSGILGGVP